MGCKFAGLLFCLFFSLGLEADLLIPLTETPVEVDGILEEEAWAKALVLTLPYETQPGENTPARVETEALITYDQANVYVAFRAHDPNPHLIRARYRDRDQSWKDDFIGIVFDTFDDGRRAFEFFVNPLGAQLDLFFDDVNGNEDSSWDAIWDSAGRITEGGYEVEIAIPFSSLRFPSSTGFQTWGIDLVRYMPREERYRMSNNPRERDLSCYLCRLTKVEGFQGVSPGKNLEITPSFTSGRSESREGDALPDGAFEEGDLDSELGLNVRWGITPNWALNATVNPDFSQVESDVVQLDVNTQFALFFPEKRPFFLEGADFFKTPMDAVFTRNVVQPSWGAKFTGKQGRHALGFFSAQDDATSFLIPGLESSNVEILETESLDSSLRYRMDLGENSAFGALITSRTADDYLNQVAGFDGLWRPTSSDTLRVQYLRSDTEYPLTTAEEFGQPLGSFSDDAFALEYQRNGRNWNFWGSYEDVGRDFRADLGFVPQVDIRERELNGNRVWWGDEDDPYNRLALGAGVEFREDQSGNRRGEEYATWFNFQGSRESSVFLRFKLEDRVFDGRTFNDLKGIFFNGQIQALPWLRAQLSGTISDGIDFSHTRSADEFRLSPSLTLDFGLHVQAELSHTFSQLDVQGGNLFEAELSRLRVVYQFNLRTFVRGVFQLTQIERNVALYEDSEDVEPVSEFLANQILFGYKVNPQTVFFLGYSDSFRGEEAFGLTEDNRSIFLKVSYAWLP